MIKSIHFITKDLTEMADMKKALPEFNNDPRGYMAWNIPMSVFGDAAQKMNISLQYSNGLYIFRAADQYIRLQYRSRIWHMRCNDALFLLSRNLFTQITVNHIGPVVEVSTIDDTFYFMNTDEPTRVVSEINYLPITNEYDSHYKRT